MYMIMCLTLISSNAFAQEFPESKAEFYKTGEVFAHCGAHFGFAAEVARSNGLPDTAKVFEGVERGWKLGGLFLLAGGLEAHADSETLFKNMAEVKFDQFRSLRELYPDDFSARMLTEFEADCAPWVPLQKNLIAAFRRMAADGEK